MRKLAIFIAACLLGLPAAQSAPARSWEFRVFLDNRPVGEHRFTVTDTESGELLQSRAQFDVRILGFNIYRYRHQATERWEANCLRKLQSETLTNGKRQDVNTAFERCVMSFAYWNPQILRARELINSQTGTPVAIDVRSLGTEQIVVKGSPQKAARYHLAGPDIAIDLWYVNSQWVALESAVDGGRRLRYELM
jgi:hypothetical protein